MKRGNLYLDLQPGDEVWIADETQIRVVAKLNSKQTRVCVSAPESIGIEFIKGKSHATRYAKQKPR